MLKDGLFVVSLINALDDVDLQVRAWCCFQTLIECSQSDDSMSYRGNMVTLLENNASPEIVVLVARELVGGAFSK